MTPEEYFKKWSENCRIFINYKPIHDHEDMMRFAKDYHAEQLRLCGVGSSKPENKTRSVTLIRLAINLGFSAGPAIGGIIITTMGYGGLFWVDGITCILATLVLINVLNPKKSKVL